MNIFKDLSVSDQRAEKMKTFFLKQRQVRRDERLRANQAEVERLARKSRLVQTTQLKENHNHVNYTILPVPKKYPLMPEEVSACKTAYELYRNAQLHVTTQTRAGLLIHSMLYSLGILVDLNEVEDFFATKRKNVSLSDVLEFVQSLKQRKGIRTRERDTELREIYTALGGETSGDGSIYAKALHETLFELLGMTLSEKAPINQYGDLESPEEYYQQEVQLPEEEKVVGDEDEPPMTPLTKRYVRTARNSISEAHVIRRNEADFFPGEPNDLGSTLIGGPPKGYRFIPNGMFGAGFYKDAKADVVPDSHFPSMEDDAPEEVEEGSLRDVFFDIPDVECPPVKPVGLLDMLSKGTEDGVLPVHSVPSPASAESRSALNMADEKSPRNHRGRPLSRPVSPEGVPSEAVLVDLVNYCKTPLPTSFKRVSAMCSTWFGQQGGVDLSMEKAKVSEPWKIAKVTKLKFQLDQLRDCVNELQKAPSVPSGDTPRRMSFNSLLSPYDIESLKREKYLWDVFLKIIFLAVTNLREMKGQTDIEKALDPRSQLSADERELLKTQLMNEKLWLQWHTKCVEIEDGRETGSATYSELIRSLDEMMSDFGIEPPEVFHPPSGDDGRMDVNVPTYDDFPHTDDDDEDAKNAAMRQQLEDLRDDPDARKIFFEQFAVFFDKFAIYRQKNGVGQFSLSRSKPKRRKEESTRREIEKLLSGCHSHDRAHTTEHLVAYNVHGEVVEHLAFMREVEAMLSRSQEEGPLLQLDAPRGQQQASTPQATSAVLPIRLPQPPPKPAARSHVVSLRPQNEGVMLRSLLGQLIAPYPNVHYHKSPVTPAAPEVLDHLLQANPLGGAATRAIVDLSGNSDKNEEEPLWINVRASSVRSESRDSSEDVAGGALWGAPLSPGGFFNRRGSKRKQKVKGVQEISCPRLVAKDGDYRVRKAIEQLSVREGRSHDVIFLRDNVIVLPMEKWKSSGVMTRISTLLTSKKGAARSSRQPRTPKKPQGLAPVQKSTRVRQCDKSSSETGLSEQGQSDSVGKERRVLPLVCSGNVVQNYHRQRRDQEAFKKRFHTKRTT